MTALWYIYTCTLNPVESNHKGWPYGPGCKSYEEQNSLYMYGLGIKTRATGLLDDRLITKLAALCN